MSVHIIDEANRCLNCKRPLCQEGCPVHTPIPQIISKFKEHQIMDAGAELFANNPMSLICSIVCDHDRQCTGHCILGRKGNPIHFFMIENYISDAYLDRISLTRKPLTGKKVAVIGAGPVGLTAAIVLSQNGYDVTVFEYKDRIGGVMQFGIPQFRLPKTILSRYVKVMKALDIRFRPNAIIGAVIRIEDLFRDGYSSVFIGTGTWKAKNLGIRGETLGNVHFGIDYLATNDAYDLGKNVAVIGMGNVAMDVARTALRRGAEKVTLFSKDQGMTASPHEVAYAELDGAEFVFGKSIDSITDEGPVFRTTLFDENGQITGVSDETELFPADSTVISISQGPRRKLIRTTAGLEGDERGLLRVDEEHMTTLKGVFAAGDVVTGPRSVVEAVDGAKKAAAAMIRYMEGEDS